MRIMVDGDDIRVAFSKDLQREPLELKACDQAVAWLRTLVFSHQNLRQS